MSTINHDNSYQDLAVFFACSVIFNLLTPTIAFANQIEINQLVEKAIETHPLVNAARADRDSTEEGIKAAKLNMLPIPSISTGYDNSTKQFVTNASLQQPLWTGGELTANVNQAIFDDKAAIEAVFEQQNKVAKNTISAWQSYINSVAMQRVYSANLNELAEFQSMMKRRVQQGVSARIELDLINNRILQEQNKNQGAQQQQRIAAARLKQMVGDSMLIENATIPTLDVLVSEAKTSSADFEGMAFNDISFYNPSVVKAAFEVESAKEVVLSKKAAIYPDLFAKFDYTYNHDDGSSDNSFSIGLNYSPGAGFSNMALARASASRVTSLTQSQEAARRTVIENIQVQYQQFVSTIDQERSLIAAIAGAQAVVNSYQRQFKTGRKSWLDVLNALRELDGYKIELAQKRSEMLGAYHNLQVDFGKMPWQEFSKNRLPTERYSPLNSVKNFLYDGKNDTVN